MVLGLEMNFGKVSNSEMLYFLCKSELSSDRCLVLVVCYESFRLLGDVTVTQI